MREFDEMVDWLLGTNRNDGNADDDDGSVQQLNNVSPLQISVSQGCSTELFCNATMASQLDTQAGMNELGMMESPFLHDSVLMPNKVGHVEQLCSQVGSSSNLIVDGMSPSGWEFSRRDDGGEQVQKNEVKEKTIEDAKLWKKNECSGKRRRDAEKHSQAEKKRRQKFNQKIRTLQSLIPYVDKVDTASVLDKAIDYVKCLQLFVNQMLENVNPTATPFGASTAALESFQHPQLGSMEPRTNEQMSYHIGEPVMPRSVSGPLLPSSHAMAQCYLPRASSPPQFHGFPPLPSPLVQMPHPPAGLQYEGFRPSYCFGLVGLGVPTTWNHQLLPVQTQQNAEETSNTEAVARALPRKDPKAHIPLSPGF